MYKLCRVDPGGSVELIEEIKRFANRLKETLPVREIYLFGSFAKGEIHEGSDIDLLIIGDFKERLFDRIGMVLDMTDLPVEPLVYSVEEFEGLKTSDSPFIKEILKTAIKLV